MKIHFVTEGSLNEYWERGPKVNCDVLVFGFSGLGEVEYGRELAGETSKLEDLAILSREAGCVVLSGCMTASYGMRRRSAAIAEGGRILGVSDMLYVCAEEDLKGGAHLKVYQTAAGKLGVCVGEDLYYPSVAETLSLCDADVIFSIFGEVEDSVPTLMLRACAFYAGVDLCMCASGIAQIAAPDGEIRLRAAKRECDYAWEVTREYRLTSVRSRGLSRRRRADY